MIANIAILLFILAVVVIDSTYGFFSSFLHLCLVIACGTLALAIWEPITVGFLLARQPYYAWAVGLLVPFALLLLLGRIATDRLVPQNVVFPDLVNKIGGGACGVGTGILTAGMLVIGLGFLPFGRALGGYQPYDLAPKGGIIESGSHLWIPVDRYTTGFFNTLSTLGFATATPLARYQPNLAKQSALYRLRIDENSAVAAMPGSVEVTQTFRHNPKLPQLHNKVARGLGKGTKKAGESIYVADTHWTNKPGSYTRGTLRVAPTQVRLAVEIPGQPRPRLLLPVASSRLVNPKNKSRSFKPLDSPDATAYGITGDENLAFAYRIPSDAKPRYLLVRNLRFKLPEPDKKAGDLARILGTPEAGKPKETKKEPPSIGGKKGFVSGNKGVAIDIGNELPREISTSVVPSLSYQADTNDITGGDATAKTGRGGKRTTAGAIYVPSHSRMVRLEITADKARSLLGEAYAAAAAIGGPYLETDRGPIQPVAYVLDMGSARKERIHVNLDVPIRSAHQLPINKLRDGDHLYLYFMVPKGTHVKAYHIGSSAGAEQPIHNLTIPR